MDFDDIMNIECLEIVLETNIWKENAAKGLNPVKSSHMSSTCGSYIFVTAWSRFILSFVCFLNSKFDCFLSVGDVK